LLKFLIGAVVRLRGIPPRFEEIEMSYQTKDCEECFGTGNEPRMRPVQPGRKIPFQPCPACGGTGKIPVEEPGK
jgi:DnaJ-class molecular chaperone